MNSSRSLIRLLTPYFSARLRQNYRLLSSAPAPSSTLHEPESSSSTSESPTNEWVHLTDNCVRRMKELQSTEAGGKLLHLSIEAGGCSGFQYNFSLDDKTNDDDRIFERDGVKLVVDNISYDFVKGATIDYLEELICSAFQVSSNPSAVGRCSWRSSFMGLIYFLKVLLSLVTMILGQFRAYWDMPHDSIEKAKGEKFVGCTIFVRMIQNNTEQAMQSSSSDERGAMNWNRR